MTHLEFCSIEVSKTLGRELNPEERKELGETVNNLIDKFEKEGSGDVKGSVLAAVKKISEDVRVASFIEKRNAALNLNRRMELADYIMNAWKNNYKEGVKAIFGNSMRAAQGSKNGVTAHTKQLTHYWVSGMTSKLAKAGHLKLAVSGSLDKEIWMAMAEMSQKKPNSQTLAKYPKAAVEIAQIFNDYNELARRSANKAGAWIQELPGYVVRRTHDFSKIQKAAGKQYKVGDPKHYTAWKDFLMERLDWEKTMPDLPIEKREKVLSSLFQQLSNGFHLQFGEGGSTGLKGLGNVGKKLSQERVLHFKTPEMEFEYHKQFAQGSTLVENMSTGLRRMARDTAVMRKLGPNAENNLKLVIEEVKKRIVDNEALGSKRGEMALNVQKEFNWQMKATWPSINGATSVPTNHVLAARSQLLRNMQTMGKLGLSVISAQTDPAFFGSVANYTGDQSLVGFMKGVIDGYVHMVGGMAKKFVKGGKVAPEVMLTASECGVGLDAANPIFSLVDDNVAGRSSKWVQKFMKLNLMSWHQDNMREGAVHMTSHRHAQHAHLPFEELPGGITSILTQFDIGPREWDLIRKSGTQVDANGVHFLTPESIMEAAPEHFDSHPKVERVIKERKSERVINRQREDVRTKVSDNYRALFSEVASWASTEAGEVERAILTLGHAPGEWPGEILRHLTLFKSFTAGIMRNHIGRELLGQTGPDAKQKAFFGLASMIVAASFMGVGSNVFRDLAKLKVPRVPETPMDALKILMAGGLQSGSMGLYGDFFFGEMKDRFGGAPLDALLGPTWGTLNDIADLWGRAKNRDDVAAKALSFALNNTPGVNAAYSLFWTRWAMDYFIVHRLQETINPGYLMRMENRLLREQNQTLMFPPSQRIPYGGGMP